MAGDVWKALRAIVARRDGARCVYCRVPTAATLEHVHARSLTHDHSLENLRLACPHCNSTKGDRDPAEWVRSRGWELAGLDTAHVSVTEMIRAHFAPEYRDGTLNTGSTNSRLRMSAGVCELQVRPGKGHPWVTFRLGSEDDPRVVRASYDFLRRHHTPRAAKRHTRGRKRK